MKLSVLFLILAIALFVLSSIPKVQRTWMMAFGLALLTASFLPFLNVRIGN